jgi:hypothetical protein
MSVRDGRRAPFCWQEVATLRAIKDRCERAGADGRALTLAHALAIYVAMTWLANDRFRAGGRDGFDASRAEIAAHAGVTDRTVDRYVDVFTELGILAIERRRDGALNLPNRWVLMERGGELSSPPLANPIRQGGEPNTGGVANSTAPLFKKEEEGNTPPKPPASGGRRRDRDRFTKDCATYAQRHFPDLRDGRDAVRQAVVYGDASTLEQVAAWIDEHFRAGAA